MAGKNGTNGAGSSSGLTELLGEQSKVTEQLQYQVLDSRLLWGAVIILANRGASIQIGVTKDNSAWAVQFWDGKFPEKRYYKTTDELNHTLAAICRNGWHGTMPEMLETAIRENGW